MRKPQKIVQWRFAFFFILLATINSRFIGIDSDSISLSELAQLQNVPQSFKAIVDTFSFATSQYSPLYTLLLHLWKTLFGDSLFALRALSAILSFTTLFPLFGIARLLFNKRIAYTTLALYAISPMAVTLSQTISPLTLFLQFSLMSTWSLLMLLRRSHPEYKIFYVFTVLGALFTHPAFWFLLIFHQLTVAWTFLNKKTRHLTFKNWFYFESMLLIGVFLTLPEKLPALHLPFERGWYSPLKALASYLFVQSGSIPLCILFSLVLFQLFFNSRRYHTVSHQFSSTISFILFWLITVTILPFMFSFPEDYFGRANGAYAGLFPFLFLIAAGIDTYEHKNRSKVIIIAALTLSTMSVHHIYETSSTAPWKEIVQEMSDIPTSKILVGKKYESVVNYYGIDSTYSPHLIEMEDEWERAVKEIADTSVTILILQTKLNNEQDSLLSYLSKEFLKVSDSTYYSLGIFNNRKGTIRKTLLQRKGYE